MSWTNLPGSSLRMGIKHISLKSLVNIRIVTAEIFLMWTNVARTNVAETNVTVTVEICYRCS